MTISRETPPPASRTRPVQILRIISYLCHSPSRFAQLRSNLFAFAAQANPNAGCKYQIGESS
ncbi:MAG: hypothetical protein ORN98_02155 [Alphaproteobacteria bacterium]|nr:hypothetical protein [Alphaproteobacteria bacterium]